MNPEVLNQLLTGIVFTILAFIPGITISLIAYHQDRIRHWRNNRKKEAAK